MFECHRMTLEVGGGDGRRGHRERVAEGEGRGVRSGLDSQVKEFVVEDK